MSATAVQTLNNAEQFMVIKNYRTSAVLYTVALHCLEAGSSPRLIAAILCKRAECLLRLVSTLSSFLKMFKKFKPSFFTFVTAAIYFTFRIMFHKFYAIAEMVSTVSIRKTGRERED